MSSCAGWGHIRQLVVPDWAVRALQKCNQLRGAANLLSPAMVRCLSGGRYVSERMLCGESHEGAV